MNLLRPFGLLLLTAFCLAGYPAWLSAAPTPTEGLVVSTSQPDGTAIEVRAFGDEFFHCFKTADGYTVVKDNTSGFWHYVGGFDTKGMPVASPGIVGKNSPQAYGLTKNILPAKDKIRQFRSQNYQILRGPGERQVMEEKIQRLRDRGVTDAEMKPLLETYIQKFKSPDSSLRMISASVPQFSPPPPFNNSNVVGVCILADFPDRPASVDQVKILNMLTQEGYTQDGHTGSFRDYYKRQSDGKVDFSHIVTQYIRMDKNFDEYNTGNGAAVFVAELLKKAETIDIAGFDNLTIQGSRGIALSFAYAGDRPTEWNTGLWPHASMGGLSGKTLKGKPLWGYQMTDISSVPVIGTFCHELGHQVFLFGDYYDYGADEFKSSGLGNHCLMGGGNHLHDGKIPAPLNPYLRCSIGWGTYKTLTTGSYTASATARDAYKLVKSNKSTEYFVFEARHPSGDEYQRSLGFRGLGVWHIDELATQGTKYAPNEMQNMTPEKHYECSLEQADGQFHLERGMNSGDASDYYGVNVTTFSSTTTPNNNWWDNTSSEFTISNIAIGEGIVTFNAKISGGDPGILKVIYPNGGETFFPGQSMNITWSGEFNVRVELWMDDQLYQVLAPNIPSTQFSYVWRIPASFPNGDRFKIKVVSLKDAKTYDFSDDDFSIEREYTVTPNETIPPDSTYIGTLTIKDDGEIDYFSLRVDLETDDASKIDISLAPSNLWGITDTPMVFNGGQQIQSVINRANLTNTVWTDRSATPIGKSSSPFTGRFAPLNWVNSDIYRGKSPKGVWTIVIRNRGTTSALIKNWGIAVVPIKPTVSFDKWTGLVTQGDTIRVKLVSSKPSSDAFPIQVIYRLSGTAVYGKDYNISDSIIDMRGSAAFQTGSKFAEIPVAALIQKEYSRPKTVTLQIQQVINGTLISPSSFNLSILWKGDKPIVYMNVDTPMYLYPEDGQGLINVRIRLTNTIDQSISLSMASAGTARENLNFTVNPQKVTFNAGDTERTVQLTILKDKSWYPNDRELKLQLGDFITGQNVAQLINDPATPSELDFVIRQTVFRPILKFSGTGQNVPKVNGRVVIPYELSGPCGEVVKLKFSAAGSAERGVDYTLPEGLSTQIAPGTTAGALGLNILDNHKVSGALNIQLGFAEVSGPLIGIPFKYNLVIEEGDYKRYPVVSFTSTVSQGKAGSTVKIEAYLSRESQEKVTVPLAIGGSAVAGVDYAVFTPYINIPAGKRSGSVKIKLPRNTTYQDPRTLVLTIINPLNAVYAADAASHTLLIVNSNPLPELCLELLQNQVARDAFAEVAVTLNEKQSYDVPVPFTIETDLPPKAYTVSGTVNGNMLIARRQTRGAIRIELNQPYRDSSLLDTVHICVGNTPYFPVTGDTVQTITFRNIFKGEGYAQELLASDFAVSGKPGTVFFSKPNIYGLYWNPGRSRYQKTSAVIPVNLYPAASVKAVLTRSPRLYNKAELSRLYRNGGSVLNWNNQDSTLNIALAAKASFDNNVKLNAPAGTMLTLAIPEIFSVQNTSGASILDSDSGFVRPGMTVTLKGNGFGEKPIIWFEIPKGNKTGKLLCKHKTFPFTSLVGKPSATFPENGMGEVSFTVPLFPDTLPGTQAVLVINSGVGIKAVKVNIRR